MSCQRIQECTEMWLLIFNLAEPMQDKSEGKLDVFFIFFIEVFKFSKISHSQAFSGGVCQGTLYSLACECVASHHLIEPCQSRSQGIPQSACAIYCQGPKIQIDPDRHTDGGFFSK